MLGISTVKKTSGAQGRAPTLKQIKPLTDYGATVGTVDIQRFPEELTHQPTGPCGSCRTKNQSGMRGQRPLSRRTGAWITELSDRPYSLPARFERRDHAFERYFCFEPPPRVGLRPLP